MLNTIDSLTEFGKEGNFAFKFTGLISTDIMTKLSTAQDIFLYEILKINNLETSNCTLSFENLQKNLNDNNIQLELQEIS